MMLFPSSHSRFPEKVDRFNVEALLGEGGMSSLFIATDPLSEGPIALKVLLEKFLCRDEVVERFIHEGEILRELNHPGIVGFIDQGKWEGGYFLALDLVQGISLKKWMERTVPTLPRAIEIVLEISEAVSHLHQKGIIHRDLKPENVLLTDCGKVKLIDLGIAMKMGEPQKEGPFPPGFLGTLSYMSPEQRRNPNHISFSSDLFSIGIIAYELVLGEVSHGHVHLSLMPKAFQKILGKALQPDPLDRYTNLTDFIADLVSYRTHLSRAPLEERLSLVSETFRDLEKGLEELSHKQPSANPQAVIEANWAVQRVGIHHPFIYDFYKQDEHWCFFFGESLSCGSKGVIEVAFLKGLERAARGPIKDWGEKIWNEIKTDQTNLYRFVSLRLTKNKFSFLSYGSISLIQIQPKMVWKKWGGDDLQRDVEGEASPFHLFEGEWGEQDLFVLEPTGFFGENIEKFLKLSDDGGVSRGVHPVFEEKFKALFPYRSEGRPLFLATFCRIS